MTTSCFSPEAEDVLKLVVVFRRFPEVGSQMNRIDNRDLPRLALNAPPRRGAAWFWIGSGSGRAGPVDESQLKHSDGN